MGRLSRLLPAWLAAGLVMAGAAWPGETPETAGSGPPLVELFTSQGCSSCPPADRLLSELAAEGRVIALAFHVDYWNYIGWTDPFSSGRWSERQRGYARFFGVDRIYTPQLVVDGRLEGVGSDRREVEAMLSRAAGGHRAVLGLELDRSGGELAAIVRARALGAPPENPLQPWLAIAESGHSTPVGRGENADRTLKNDNVVRRLEPLGPPVTLGAGDEARWRAPVALEPGWDRERVRLVAFLQDPASGDVAGAAQTGLADH